MANTKQRLTLRVGELARQVGVSPDTIRHYERVGVLPRAQRSVVGYREYPASALERLRVVRGALAAGFTLASLAQIFTLRERGGVPCQEVRRLASERLTALEKLLAEITAERTQLLRLLAQWDLRLAATPTGEASGLLTSLATVPGEHHHEAPLIASAPRLLPRRQAKGAGRGSLRR